MATFVILYNWHKRVLDALIFLRIHILRITMPSSCALLVVISKAICILISLASLVRRIVPRSQPNSFHLSRLDHPAIYYQ